MRTQFEISNWALRHLGMKKIGSLAGTDPAAIACNDFFNPSRDDVFREFQWPFATVQQPLEQSGVTVPLGWTFTYTHPVNNVATVWSVFNLATQLTKDAQNFQIYYIPESNTKIIASNLESAYAEITYIVEDPLIWDAKFDMAMSYRLASAMAVALTGDASKATALAQVYYSLIAEAKRVSSNEKIRKPPQQSGYQSAR